MPWWMMEAQQESVRPVELPTLAELTETEVGPLVAGDWLVTITPFMRDISSSSLAWWDQVMRTAEDAYRRWLDADPMARLRMTLTVPDSFQRAPWLRVEQRGSVALLKAIPETIRSELIAQREVGSIHIIFKVLRVYQPGGLGERTALLKQLVDQKVPTVMSEWLLALRSWRRWLTRVGELKIQTPDPVLLLATLDKFAAELSKQSQQISFRLQVARATLRVDVNPTEVGVYQFAETLLAEGGSAAHAVGKTKEVKIKAIDGSRDPHPPPPAPYVQPGGKGGKDGGKGTGKNGGKDGGKKQDGKGGSKGDFKPEFTANGKPICRYFLSSGGCKKGAQCSFPHEWGSQSKQGRCWECGSVHHMKPDCPTLKKDTPKVMKTDSKKEVVIEATPAPTSTGEPMGGANQPSSGQPAALNPWRSQERFLCRKRCM